MPGTALDNENSVADKTGKAPCLEQGDEERDSDSPGCRGSTELER